MKKSTFYFKSLLLAAGLLLGSANAWAGDVTTLYEKGTAGHEWTNADIASSGTYVWGGNAEIATKGYPYVSGNGGRTSSMTIAPSSDVILTVDAVWFTGGDGSYGNNYTYFRIGNNLEFQAHTTNQTGNVVINGSSNVISNACGKNNGNRTDDEWTIHAVINTATKELTELTLAGKNGTKKATYTLASPVSLGANATFTSMTFGTHREKYAPYCGLMSLSIGEETQAVSGVGYTINYILGDKLVKSVAGEGIVDQEIAADVAIDGTEEGYEGKHYLITAAEAPSMTLVSEAASNVLDVPVREPYTATLKVKTTIGVNDPVLVETPLVETDAKVHTWGYAYPMYVLNDGKYYKADDTTTFGEGGVFTDGQVIERFVSYSTADESVVFFQDAEAAAGTNYSYSNGGSGYVAAQNKRDRGISVGTLDAGIYSFTVNITAANRRSLVIRQSTNDPLASLGTSNVDMTKGLKSTYFELGEETSDLWINGANSGEDRTNQSEDFDYVLIKKVPATVPVTISGAGYATFSYDDPLNLTKANTPEGLTAYYVGSEGVGEKYISLTEINQTVAPNEGILFEGTPGETYYVSVVVNGNELEGNQLVATDGYEVAAGNFVFAYKNGTYANPGFYTLTTATTVAAGKAYLKKQTSEVKAMFLPIDGGTATGVDAPVAAEAAEEDGVLYNTAGQQVTKDFKGIVIKDGKKYFNK